MAGKNLRKRDAIGLLISIAAWLVASGVLEMAQVRADENAAADEEVHVVGIYEGVPDPDGVPGETVARLRIDRPGKEVALVLASYETVTWEFSVGEMSSVSKVTLLGNGRQPVRGLPAGVPIENTYSEKGETLPVVYRDRSWRFQLFLRDIARRAGVPRIASFHGAYRAEEEFVIDGVQDDPQLSADYPQPTPFDELPDVAKMLRFDAYHYVGNCVSYGEHTLAGPNEDDLRPLPGNVRRIAIDPETKQCFGVTGHRELYRVDLERQAVEEAPLGKEAPGNESLWEVTFDSKRKRWIFGAYDLLEYTPKKNKWSPFSKRSCTLDALAYSAFDDRFYMVEFETHDDGDVASLIVLDAAGKVLSDSPLKQPIVPSRGWCHTSLIPLDGFLVMITAPEIRDFPTPLTESYTYLISLETGEAW